MREPPARCIAGWCSSADVRSLLSLYPAPLLLYGCYTIDFACFLCPALLLSSRTLPGSVVQDCQTEDDEFALRNDYFKLDSPTFERIIKEGNGGGLQVLCCIG